jgi:hypothetical protein
MMIDSKWSYDLLAEAEVGKFLDKYFYMNYTNDFHRFSNKNEQLKGKDVSFTIDDLNNIVVDEKSQGNYVNKNLPTFAFEVAYTKPGKGFRIGWLLDSNKESQYYFLIWIWAKKEKEYKAEDISKLRCLLIEKEMIKIFLEKEGLIFNKIPDITKLIREKDNQGKQDWINFGNFYFFYSKNLAEKPINVVIKRNILEKLALLDIEVTRNYVNIKRKVIEI